MDFIYQNTVEEYLITLGLFLGLFIIFKIINNFLIKYLEKLAKKTKIQIDDLLIDFLKEIKWNFYMILSLFISIKNLQIPQIINTSIYYILIILLGWYLAKGSSKLVNHYIQRHIQSLEKKESKSSKSMIRVFGLIIKIILWAIILLTLLSNLGIQVTPIIASMGIGGIAIALALQSILGDLFGAFIIYFDKPFEEGDFIIIGSDMGVVKHIGIKSTRIQALQGQELVISNTELVNSRINNYKQMEKRRIVFSFGVKYDSGIKKLQLIKSIVNEIFKKIDKATIDRVHFKEFGDFSLNYEVVYYVQTSDYNIYMDIQEEINLELYKEFEKNKIEFAFPTQTIELQK